MKKRILSALLLILFMTQILAGCSLFSEEQKYRKGFDESDLNAPLVPSYSPHTNIDKPQENESQLPPGFSYNLSWAMGDVYAYWGGFIRISVENAGENDMFVYRYGILVNWSYPSDWIYEERNVLIPAKEIKSLGLVYFNAPNTTGNYSYQVTLSILVKDNELFDQYNVTSWYDNGTVKSKENLLSVKSLEGVNDVKITYNYKLYYDRLNKKVEFDDPQVLDLASDIKNRYPGEYNIYQVLDLYDFTLYNLSYISDQVGRDYWCYPDETLGRGGGDCEDFSILFSSTVGALGGTTRVYLTQTHAFSALYIGNSSLMKNEILEAIEIYYGTEPNFVIFSDEGSYWLAADPAGSLYMGGLPADAEPALRSEAPLSYGFNFDDTTEINVIDVKE